METNNMRHYDKARSVPANAQKPFSNGRFTGTDINPMWRIKMLTEMFGPAGIGWYTEVTRQEHIPVDDNNLLVFVDLNLYVKEGDTWSKPIFGTGGNALKLKGKGDDDGYKKAYTDALSIACKALGIGADIWYSADAGDNTDPTSKYSDMYETIDKAKQNSLDIQSKDTPVCDRCGKPITGWIDAKGQRYNATAIIKRSRDKYNGCYCASCMTEIAQNQKKVS